MDNAAKILQRRHWALIAIRAAGLVLVVYGGIFTLRGLATSLGYSLNGTSFLSGLTTFWGNENFNPFWHGLSILAPGLLLAMCSRRIARWLVPAFRHECPHCGYALRQLTTARCPECGFATGSTGEHLGPAPRQ